MSSEVLKLILQNISNPVRKKTEEAVTRIWVVRNNLSQVVDYASNKSKTDLSKYSDLIDALYYAADEKTNLENEQKPLVEGINCDPEERNFKYKYLNIKKPYVQAVFVLNAPCFNGKELNGRLVFLHHGNLTPLLLTQSYFHRLRRFYHARPVTKQEYHYRFQQSSLYWEPLNIYRTDFSLSLLRSWRTFWKARVEADVFSSLYIKFSSFIWEVWKIPLTCKGTGEVKKQPKIAYFKKFF